jgi:hypothetical protein
MDGAMTWVKVQSADELRDGMTVEIRPCGFCGRTERLVLIRPAATDLPMALNGDGDMVASGGAWQTAPGLCLHPRRPFDPSSAIREGRLWRLAEQEPAAEQAEPRTLERVR